jgi:hypothetical protein
MDASHQDATISALEAATDALLIALGKRPDPDLEAPAAALKAREAALRFLVRADVATRPPDLNARLRRILDRDREAAEQLRIEMDSLRDRLASTLSADAHLRPTNRRDRASAVMEPGPPGSIWGEPHWCASGASLKVRAPDADTPSGRLSMRGDQADVPRRT